LGLSARGINDPPLEQLNGSASVAEPIIRGVEAVDIKGVAWRESGRGAGVRGALVIGLFVFSFPGAHDFDVADPRGNFAVFSISISRFF